MHASDDPSGPLFRKTLEWQPGASAPRDGTECWVRGEPFQRKKGGEFVFMYGRLAFKPTLESRSGRVVWSFTRADGAYCFGIDSWHPIST